MRRITFEKVVKTTFFSFLLLILATPLIGQAQNSPKDSIPTSRYKLPNQDLFTNKNLPQASSIHLPSTNVKHVVEYDVLTGMYKVQKRVGNVNVGLPRYMTLKQYRAYDMNKSKNDYWRSKISSLDSTSTQDGNLLKRFLNPSIEIDGFDRIFGSNKISIKPNGSAELSFGVNISTQDNPSLEESLRTTTTFDFREKIQMGVTGEIGTKVKVGITYNTEATFDFENQTKVGYTGEDDEIIQDIEIGNVSLPLNGTLITGGQNLFGVKTQLKFGRLKLTSVISQQKSETQVVEMKGGAMQQKFEILADAYDVNRHFFLAHYFRESFDYTMSSLPVLNTGVNITRVEVWVTNKNGSYDESRSILATMDLGEGPRPANSAYPNIPGIAFSSGFFPDNKLNSLHQELSELSNIRDINQVTSALSSFKSNDFKTGRDYEKMQFARRLKNSEYEVHRQLGYISLNTSLSADEVLAVAFQYTYQGKTYQVGEFSNDNVPAPQTLLLKMLKSTTPTPKLPTWDLMMKNIYAIGAYQVQQDKFKLNIMFRNDKTGKAINYIPEGPTVENGGINGQILLRTMSLDKLNSNRDPQPDGVFDFVEGLTIKSSNGRVIFPVIEPFGSHLAEKFSNPILASKYAFPELYDSTQTIARQIAEKNKFYLEGSYQSSSGSEIQLNAMNVQPGSVTVTAGGRKLEESEYIVDYTLGRVTITNQALLSSGTPIRVSLENNSLFSIQTKTLIGTHADYEFSEDFVLGGTVMHLQEKPLTNKVNIGSEPISNTIWGVDGRYKTEVPWLTRMVDMLPFLETKEKSTISIEGEFAQLVPGTANVVGQGGTAYIDDFEGAKSYSPMNSDLPWSLASTPQKQNRLFPEAETSINSDTIEQRSYGYNRALLSVYRNREELLRDRSAKPGYIGKDEQSDHLVREVYEQDLFPNKTSINGIPTRLPILNFAFYPNEKGPYNFDTEATSISAGTDVNGFLNDPESRWGGVMRSLSSNDFEERNYEFIEFWLMDPFVNDIEKGKGKGDDGYFYINLGNISEDILRDSRLSWENGLPRDVVVKQVDTTAWGRISTQQMAVDAFDQNPSSRSFQDVGFDGLRDEDEQSFYGGYLSKIADLHGFPSEAFLKAKEDPANDNFHYFLGPDYDSQELSILERFKYYLGPDGSTPTPEQSPLSFNASRGTQPDAEDINNDNTLNETEGYYQYRVRIHPGSLNVGNNYITDKRIDYNERRNGDKDSVTWYQFKIPIFEPESKFGTIEGFRSIRFMRLFMRGFNQPVVMRMANFRLVSGQWRKYTYDLAEASEGLQTDQSSQASFDISSVNIEENGHRVPIKYVLPPNINRVIDPSNPQLRELNEQSISLRVKDLEDGDARAAFRNLDFDLRKYGRLQMEVHAEKFTTGEGLDNENIVNGPLKDGDLSIFIRLGSDYKQNYYEYEIPLSVTEAAEYSNDNPDHRKLVWPEDNRFNIPLDILPKLKLKRDEKILKGISSVRYNVPYRDSIGNHTVSVVGTPNLSNIRTIMIGVRNPSKNSTNLFDDGLDKSAEVWVNELRLTDFDEHGGWAANGRIVAKLADFGTLSLSANKMTPGFGSIEKKVSERNQENIFQYDFSAAAEMGNFFPKHNGVKLPVYFGYSESFRDPEYNPLDPDVKMEDVINSKSYPEEAKEKLLRQSRDYTKRKAFNVTNAKIQTFRSKARVDTLKKQGKASKTHPLSIQNFSVSYNYSELMHYDINTDYDRTLNHSGGLNYIWNAQPKNIRVFKNVKWLRNPWLRIVRDFNFYPMPNQLLFRTNMDRNYQETQTRNVANPDLIIDPLFQKRFSWSREYGLRYNITKGLKVDFKATNLAMIDEPEGKLNRLDDDYEYKRDSIWNNVQDLGRTTQYTHKFNATYTLPINKIPILNWVTANARYTANYTWNTGAQTETGLSLGNNIKNYQTAQLSTNANLQNFYNKVDYLKTVNRRFKNASRDTKAKPKFKNVKWEDQEVKLKAKRTKVFRHKLGTKSVKIRVVNAKGQLIDGKSKIIDKNKVSFKPDEAVTDAKIVITGKVPVKKAISTILTDGVLNLAMAVKNVSATYSENNGTLVPGFMPRTQYMGMSDNFGSTAPGWEFIMGLQNPNFGTMAWENDWLSSDTLQSQPIVHTHQGTVNLRATIEPFPGFRIDLTANRSMSRNNSSTFFTDPVTRALEEQNRLVSGNFQTTFNSLPTAFKKTDMNNYRSEVFEQFKSYRTDVAHRIANTRSSSGYNKADLNLNSDGEEFDNGYPKGYNSNSQQVLVPAFIAAYSGQSPSEVGLTPFPRLPFPNWRVKYDGLSKIKGLNKLFKKVTITHGFTSVYSVGSYRQDAAFHDESRFDGMSYQADQLGYFIPENQMDGLSISEKFSPLIGLDFGWEIGLTTRFEIRKSRNVSLSFANNQLVEMLGDELVFGLGWRIQELPINIKVGGKTSGFKSDLNIRADLAIRDNMTIIHKLDEDADQITAGQKNTTIKLSTDYNLSERFNLRFYYDQVINSPRVSTSWRTSNTQVGFSLRFTLI